MRTPRLARVPPSTAKWSVIARARRYATRSYSITPRSSYRARYVWPSSKRSAALICCVPMARATFAMSTDSVSWRTPTSITMIAPKYWATWYYVNSRQLCTYHGRYPSNWTIHQLCPQPLARWWSCVALSPSSGMEIVRPSRRWRLRCAIPSEYLMGLCKSSALSFGVTVLAVMSF